MAVWLRPPNGWISRYRGASEPTLSVPSHSYILVSLLPPPPVSFPCFFLFPPEPPSLPTRDRKEALAQTWANVFYFTSHVFILKHISGKKTKPHRQISTSKFYFMDITAQVETNWKASPFLFCLKGTGRDVLWVRRDTVREKWELGKRSEEVYTVPRVLLGSVRDPQVGLIS